MHKEHRSAYAAQPADFKTLTARFNEKPLLRLYGDLETLDQGYLQATADNDLVKSAVSAEAEKTKKKRKATTAGVDKRPRVDPESLGHSHAPLLRFTAEEVVFDELHLMLRLMDRLLSALIRSVPEDKRPQLLDALRKATKIPGLVLVEDDTGMKLQVYLLSSQAHFLHTHTYIYIYTRIYTPT